MLEKFNIIFTGIAEEKKLELTQTLKLMGEFCNKIPPLSAHINKALEAGFNIIEFIDNNFEGYEGAKQFGASCSYQDKKIIINAEQDSSEMFHCILFELGNAVNFELQRASIQFQYINEQHYAETIERNEFNTVVNINRLILETLKLLENNETLKQFFPFFPLDNIKESIKQAEAIVNDTFEDHKNSEYYLPHRDFYAKEVKTYFEHPITQTQQLKNFINSRNIDNIKILLEKIKIVTKEHLQYVFNETLNESSLDIIKLLLNHSSANVLLKNELFKMAILMDENKIDVLDKALSQTLEEKNIFDHKNLSSIKSKKLAEIFYKYPSAILNEEAFLYAVNNNDKELINLTLDNNIKIKFNAHDLNIICNLKDQDILDKYLDQLDEINMFNGGFNRSWKRWEKDILNKVLESSKNIENEFYLEVVLDYCFPETIDNILKRFIKNELIEKRLEKALKYNNLKYVEILTKYVGNADNAEAIEDEYSQPTLLHNDEISLIGE